MKKFLLFLTLAMLPFTLNANTQDKLTSAITAGSLDGVKQALAQGAALNTADTQENLPLTLAAFEGKEDIVKYLAELGANINIKHTNDMTPLMYAAHEGHLGIVKYLVKNGADINAQSSPNKERAWVYAALNNKTKTTKYLVNKGSLLDYEDKDKLTILQSVVSQGNLNLYKFLYKNLNFKPGKEEIQKLFQYSVMNGNLSAMRYFIKQGADVNGIAAARRPLESAALANNPNIETLKYLLSKGADPKLKTRINDIPLAAYGPRYVYNNGENIKLTVGDMAFMVSQARDLEDIVHYLISQNIVAPHELLLENAVLSGNLDMVKYFYDYTGGDEASVHSAVRGAVKTGNLEILKYLFKETMSADTAKLYAQEFLGATYLADNPAMIELLLNTAELPLSHRYDSQGYTLLMIAAYYNNPQTLTYLLDKGANIEQRAYHEETPLIMAAFRGNNDIVKILLARSAKIEAKTDNNITPLLTASLNGHFEVVKTLVENGADINARSRINGTPVMLAAVGGHLDIVKYLVKHKANIKAKDEDGKTALDWARQNKHKEVAAYLSKIK
ncbi:ankyrin repeat protein [Elusimicrobium simillimum]|uniref:ankyrin repeat domain-containing protein n=1 Tax=Elusimicrobium simillimum TaxID=3143438 RepID=UPI003C6FED5A